MQSITKWLWPLLPTLEYISRADGNGAVRSATLRAGCAPRERNGHRPTAIPAAPQAFVGADCFGAAAARAAAAALESAGFAVTWLAKPRDGTIYCSTNGDALPAGIRA